MVSSFLPHFLFFGLLAGGLIFPGWLLGRAIGASSGPAGALLGSAVMLFNLVLVLDALGIRLDLPHLATGLSLLCAILVVMARNRHFQSFRNLPVPRAAWCWQPCHWLFVPAAIGGIVMALHALIDPLSGFDTRFRWDFLGRQIVRLGSLDFYPAVTEKDFLQYGWCDGIAPLVSSLYAWAYLCLGRIEPWATTPIVLSQGTVLFYMVWRLTVLRSGSAAAAAACAVLSTSAAFLWGIVIGQETGITALSLIAMFWFIETFHATQNRHWLIWAGLSAGAGALAREYGLAFIPIGILALAWRKSPRRDWLIFACTAFLVALPWYLRNWARTGNPLYCHGIGALFPTNSVYDDYNRALATINAITQEPASTLMLLFKYVVFYAGIPIILGSLAGILRWRKDLPWLAAILSIVAIWLWSVGFTSGGYVYSLRVLTPAIALGAVLCGGWLARVATARHCWLLALLVMAISTDAASRSLHLPFETGPVWRQPGVYAWREIPQAFNQWRASRNWQAITDAAEGRKILVTDPSIHAFLLERGDRPVPYFSPDVRFLFGTDGTFSDSQARLRALGFRFLLVTRHNLVNDKQLAAHSFFRELEATEPVLTTPMIYLYDLYHSTPKPNVEGRLAP